MKNYIGPLLVSIFAGLIIWLFIDVISQGNRITKLETRFEDCVDCSQRQNKIGDYTYSTYKFVDVDENGEIILEADIDLLSEQFRWKCVSIDEIIRGNQEVDLGKVIQDYRADAELKDAKGIICVGTASSEGDTKGEETRARDRIETLINLVNTNLDLNKRIPIYGFNFGKYNKVSNNECSDATIDQRRILLVKIIKRSDKLTDDKLEASLSRKFVEKATDPNITFPIDIREYSMFNSGKRMLIYGRKNE